MIETDNTNLARQKLAVYTKKPIKLVTIAELNIRSGGIIGSGYLAVTREYEKFYVIALNENRPDTNENSFVHEVLHQILNFMDYPNVYLNEDFILYSLPEIFRPIPVKLQAILGSVIDHAKVYQLMEDEFDLDMNQYFLNIIEQKEKMLNKNASNNGLDIIFNTQQNIIHGIEFFFYWENLTSELLNIFLSTSQSAYNICKSFNKKYPKNNWLEPEGAYGLGKKLLKRVIQYGEKHKLGELNNVWKAIKIEKRKNYFIE